MRCLRTAEGPLPSAMQLVGKVDDYLAATGLRPVHISEICAHLNVTRRTLHRAFFDALGLGPITYLRYKRLCAIHSVLRDSDPATTTVAQVAMQHGFIELGRFSHYYHTLFGEYPSETLGSRGPRIAPKWRDHTPSPPRSRIDAGERPGETCGLQELRILDRSSDQPLDGRRRRTPLRRCALPKYRKQPHAK